MPYLATKFFAMLGAVDVVPEHFVEPLVPYILQAALKELGLSAEDG